MEFYEKVSSTFSIPLQSEGVSQSDGVVASKKYTIPPPRLCPECREQRRLTFRNERKLYKRKCDATGKDIVSIYSPDKKYRVYIQEYWWGDSWDPMSYGREFVSSRSFIDQFRDLHDSMPKVNLWVRPDMENCEYCNF